LITSAVDCPVFAAPGYLLHVGGGRLVAQKFDLGSLRLVGEPIPLQDGVASSGFLGARAVTASDAGDLAYVNAGLQRTRLAWLDRSGHERGTDPMPPGDYDWVSLSRDGKLAVVDRFETQWQSDLWLVDLERAVSTRFTFGTGLTQYANISPDGRRVVFQYQRQGATEFLIKPTSGDSPETTLFASADLKNLIQWSA